VRENGKNVAAFVVDRKGLATNSEALGHITASSESGAVPKRSENDGQKVPQEIDGMQFQQRSHTTVERLRAFAVAVY
jgi:hypothetical protein